MSSGVDVHPEPVFWWWEEGDASRVVLLTDSALIVSDSLTDTALAAVEEARRAGVVESADFGAAAQRVSVEAIERLRYVPDAHRLDLELAGGAGVAICPPRSKAGVALGVFDTLAKRLAPDRVPVDSLTDGEEDASSDPMLTIVGTMVVMGLVCLGLAVAADQAEPTGPLAGIRSTLSSVFERVGYLPALALFVIAAVVQFQRMRSAAAADEGSSRSDRVLELDLRGGAGEPLESSHAAATGAEDAWASPPADSPVGGEPGTMTEADPTTSTDSWSMPAAASAEEAWAPAVAPETAGHVEAETNAWEPGASTPLADPTDEWRPPSIEDSLDPRVPLDVASEKAGVAATDTATDDGGWFADGDGAPADGPAAVEQAHADSGGWSGALVNDPWAATESIEESTVEAVGLAEDAVGEAVDGVDAVGPAVMDTPDSTSDDIDAAFWSRSADDESQDPWWERADAADAGDPDLLPTAPHEAVFEPVEEEFVDASQGPEAQAVGWTAEGASPERPPVEATAMDDPVPAEAQTDDAWPDDAPETAAQVWPVEERAEVAADWSVEASVAEVAADWSVEASVAEVADDEEIAESSVPATFDDAWNAPAPVAPDSPFAEILDREAPMPPWASAPEPVNELVDRSTMERAIPVSLRPESAAPDEHRENRV